MKTVKLMCLCGLLLIIGTTTCFAKITINVHNQTGEKDVFLYLDSTDTADVKLTGLSDQNINKDYIYPFKKGDKKYTFSFDTVNSGNLLFGLLGPKSINTVKKELNQMIHLTHIQVLSKLLIQEKRML